MSFIVDIEVNYQTIRLVQNIFEEEDEGIKQRSKAENKIQSGEGVRNFKLFLNLIKVVLTKKLQLLARREYSNFHLSCDDLFNEGHGSIRVSSPPTLAQEKLVKSLIKVLFSQISGSSNELKTTAGHDNLILSLFIENVFVEERTVSSIQVPHDSAYNLEDIISTILDFNTVVSKNQNDKGDESRSFDFYFYYCSDKNPTIPNNDLSEEFDKIDINIDDSDLTLKSDTQVEDNADNIFTSSMFSTQTLNLTTVTLLPSSRLEGQWESLFFNDKLKQSLFNTSQLSLKLSSLKKNNSYLAISDGYNLISNGLLLLHGAPGTGKTTLCRALCQKLSIRKKQFIEESTLKNNFKGILVELSCSKIFSRWFGESSKNLGCVFTDLEKLLNSIKGSLSFVCLLIDEVETIASSRTKLIDNNESNDSVRVVNSLLTHLDRLKKFDNFIVLATSNHINTLDAAFIDRADRGFLIEKPTLEAIENILVSTLQYLSLIGVFMSKNGDTNVFDKKFYKDLLKLISKRCLVCLNQFIIFIFFY